MRTEKAELLPRNTAGRTSWGHSAGLLLGFLGLCRSPEPLLVGPGPSVRGSGVVAPSSGTVWYYGVSDW